MEWVGVPDYNQQQRLLYLENEFNLDYDCATFGHRMVFESFEYVCTKCGLIDNPEMVTETCVMIDFWPRTYARSQYFTTLFRRMFGLDGDICYITEQMREELVANIPNPGDWYQVFQTYKRYDLQEWWTSWNIMSDNPRRAKDGMIGNIVPMFRWIDNEWNNNERKKKINVFFMLYKVVELNKGDVSWVPMKLRPICLKNLDEEWKLVCSTLKLQYIPTKLTLEKFKW